MKDFSHLLKKINSQNFFCPMNSTEQSMFKEFTRSLNVLHLALVMGAVMVSLVIYFFSLTDRFFDYTDTSDIFLYICPALALFGLFSSEILTRKQINQIDPKSSLEEKLGDYRAAKVREWALIEGPLLVCIVASMQTQNMLYFIIAGILIIFLYSKKVNEAKIKEDLSLR